MEIQMSKADPHSHTVYNYVFIRENGEISVCYTPFISLNSFSPSAPITYQVISLNVP